MTASANGPAGCGAMTVCLRRDANGNGKIDNVTELFGNQTTSGFTMLAAYDLNRTA